VLLLVWPAPPSRLRELALDLLAVDPRFVACAEVADIAGVEDGSLVLLGVGPGSTTWLNQNRPLFSLRRLRVVLWPSPALGGLPALREAAPDFFDWISQVVGLPESPPGFAVAGLRAAAQHWPGVAWGGGDLDEALTAAGLGQGIRLNAETRWPQLPRLVREAPEGPLVWPGVDDRRARWRVEWALAETGRAGLSVLEQPTTEAPGWWPVHGQPMRWEEASDRLKVAGARRPGLLATLLDLEPEAVERAATRLLAGEAEEALIRGAAEAPDPGAWVAGGGRAGPAVQVEDRPHGERVAGQIAEELRRGSADLPHLSRLALDLGELDVAEAWARRSLGEGVPDAAQARGLTALALALWSRGDLVGARAALEHALELRRADPNPDTLLDLATTHHNLAMVLQDQGDLDGARAHLDRALDLYGEVHGKDARPGIADSLHQLTSLLLAQGDLDGARAQAQRALDIRVRLHGSAGPHADIAASLYLLALVLEAQGDLAGARANLKRALDIQAQFYGTDLHPEVAATLATLAAIFQAEGDLDGASAHLQRARDIQARVFGHDPHAAVSASLHQLAGILLAKGDLDGARRSLERALSIDHQLYRTKDHYSSSVTELNLAWILLQQGERAEAASLLQHALPVFRQSLPPDHAFIRQAEDLLRRASKP